jgi:hypothetical protein
MRQVLIGVALVIAGIAAFIEAHSHRPRYGCSGGFGELSALERSQIPLSQQP